MDPSTDSPPGLPQCVNPHSLSSASPPTASRKGRSAEPDTTSRNVHRASLSMPPPAKPAIARQHPVQMPSKSSDASQLQPQGAPQVMMSSSPVSGDPELTPKLDASQRMAASMPFMLPEAALRQPNTVDPETESNRMSFSSLYSFGSAIVNSARGIAGSGPSSFAGSEQDCTYDFGGQLRFMANRKLSADREYWFRAYHCLIRNRCNDVHS
jgi:inositol-hexakisphosphate/diphosphoinositol-pentakisphosphate 1-kinase